MDRPGRPGRRKSNEDRYQVRCLKVTYMMVGRLPLSIVAFCAEESARPKRAQHLPLQCDVQMLLHTGCVAITSSHLSHFWDRSRAEGATEAAGEC